MAGLAGMGWTAGHIGPLRLSGLDGLAAVAGGQDVPPPAQGHGPTPSPDGSIRPTGPFRHARHPMNLAMQAVLWFHPKMTANLLAFNVAATAYLVLGSLREEDRLREEFGPIYGRYREGGVPFYLPRGSDESIPVEIR